MRYETALENVDPGWLPEAQKVTECTYCGRPIYEGDRFYEVLDEPMCEHCVKERIA